MDLYSALLYGNRIVGGLDVAQEEFVRAWEQMGEAG